MTDPLRKADDSYVETPKEIIDFIENSIAEVLEKEFGKTLNSKDVVILDPFAGEGQFLSRAFETGAIKKDHESKITQYEIHPDRAKKAKQNVPDTVTTEIRDTLDS